jgi:cation:H+ antiporter
MLEISVWTGVLAISLIALVHSSRKFTEASEYFGATLRIPPFIIGVTIVAVGTSLPELISSLIAVSRGSSEIVAGNVVGSNITNILFIAGISAILGKNIRFTHELIHVDLPLFITSAFFLGITMWDGQFTFIEGIIALIAVMVYILYTIQSETRYEDTEIEQEMKEELKLMRRKEQIQNVVVLLLAGFFIFFSAKYTIDSVVQLSLYLSIPSEVIAATVVAFGTSLPEVMVAIVAARQGKAEMALGNVLGSSIFNSYVVMGIPALLSPIRVPSSIISFSLPFMIIVSLLFFFFTQDKEISKWEGWMLVLFYLFFVGTLFSLM